MHLTASDMGSLLNTVANRFHGAGKKSSKDEILEVKVALRFHEKNFQKKICKQKYIQKNYEKNQLRIRAPECVEVYLELDLEFQLENSNPLRPAQDLPSF